MSIPGSGNPPPSSPSARHFVQSSSRDASPTTPTYAEHLKRYYTLEEVRHWTENRVAEWLAQQNLGRFASKFIDNDITGAILLELDYEALKDMKIKTVGERVRILVAVKTLRQDCYAAVAMAARAKNPLINEQQRIDYRSPYISSVSIPVPSTIMYSSPSLHLESHSKHEGFNITPHTDKTSKSSETKGILNRSNSFSRFLGRVDSKKSQRGSPQSSNSSSQDVPVMPPSPRNLQKRNSLEGGIMSMEKVKQTCVKVFGEDGQTRIVNVHNATEAKAIMGKVLHKFGIEETNADSYCIFVGSSTNGEARALSDAELTEICRSVDRPEKERLILRKRHQYPTHEEFKRKGTINARRQLQRAESDAMSNYSQSIKEPTLAYHGCLPDKQMTLDIITGASANHAYHPISPLSTRHPHLPKQYQQYPSDPHHETNRSMPSHSQNNPKVKRFFGERPPSEIISSNLPSFFPNHKREALETAGMNAKRMSVTPRATGSTRRDTRHSSRNSVLPELVSVLGVDLDKFLEEEEEEDGEVEEEEDGDVQQDQDNDSDDSNNKSIAQTEKSGIQVKSGDASSTAPRETLSEDEKDLGFGANDNDGDKSGADTLSYENVIQRRSSSLLHLSGAKSKPTKKSEDKEADAKTSETEKQQTPQISEDTPLSWMKGSLIGRGTFGDVYLGLNPLNGALMAVKQVELPVENSATEERKKSMVEALRREIFLLKELQHENIVQYLGSQTDDAHFSIFLEYVPGGSVAGLLASYGAFQEPLVKSFVRQILKGLHYLHGKDIVHRDIKGANVLVDNKGGVKITDFGISKKVEEGIMRLSAVSSSHRPSLQGSIFWMAPEVVKQTQYTRKADIWSLGCMMVEMFTGDHPFPEFSQMQAIFQIGSYIAPNIPEHISDAAKDFLQCTFKLKHDERPTAGQLLEHPFLYIADE